ncbi:MAG: hypothetical protein KBD76_04690 [Bacteriovorax sp.]|nr:hypothetical protein [Bacteriovorax sp.]
MSKKIIALSATLIVISGITYFFYSQDSSIGESCSPVGEEVVCTRFKCTHGIPSPTLGGSGSCSDGSSPEVIKTWTE